MQVVAAIQQKDLPALQEALARGASPDEAMANGLSALQLALYMRFSQGVDALLAAGAKPDVWSAAALGDVARLRAAPRELISKPGPDGFAPLHLAAHFGRADAVRALLNLGAPIDARGPGEPGNTALHAAAAGRRDDTAQILLAAGARWDIPDANGYLPIHVAAASGAVGIVRALIAKGADPAARSAEGKTALDYAREREMDEVVALLAAR